MPSVAEANTQFAASLYCALASETKGNLIMSPLPFSIALSLLLNGTDATTQDEIMQLTGLAGMGLDEINQQNLQLQRVLAKINGAKESFVLANSLWASLPLSFAPAFLEKGRQYYGTEMIAATRSELPARISKWSREKTHGRIDMALRETDFALLSATYFKGQWMNQFEESKTKPEEFRPEAAPAHPVPMMSQSGSYPYLEGDTFQAVALLLSGTTMYFLLPRKRLLQRNSIYAMEQTVLREGRIFSQFFQPKEGLVKLPKFTIRYDGEFLPLLERLGIRRLFDSFDALKPAVSNPEGAKATQVLQNSFIAVDEKGAEAASTLGMGFMAAAAPGWKPPKPFEFIADRPFCFWIRENGTGTILFMGRVADPTQS
ncbi:MAG TPA: serpin family protein [Candidatus Angelobacter sp.]